MYKTLHKKQGSVTVQLRFARSSVTFCAKRDNDKDGDKKIYFVRFYEDSLRLDEGEYNDWKEKLFESDLFELNWHTLS